MAQSGSSHGADGSRPGVFVTTHWSVVLTAGDPQAPQATEALSRLCEAYWYPLYAFVRRQGYSPHDAQDLTQEFFARLLKSHFLAAADRKRGRFRSFLLASMKHFLMHEWEKARAGKRGGGQVAVPIDGPSGETRYGQEPVENVTAESIYDRRWALTLLERVLNRLGADYAAAGKGALFKELHPALTGDRGLSAYAELAVRLGLTEGAVKVAVHRLRQRYGDLLREEIAQTVASPEEVEEELRNLLTALSG